MPSVFYSAQAAYNTWQEYEIRRDSVQLCLESLLLSTAGRANGMHDQTSPARAKACSVRKSGALRYQRTAPIISAITWQATLPRLILVCFMLVHAARLQDKTRDATKTLKLEPVSICFQSTPTVQPQLA